MIDMDEWVEYAIQWMIQWIWISEWLNFVNESLSETEFIDCDVPASLIFYHVFKSWFTS